MLVRSCRMALSALCARVFGCVLRPLVECVRPRLVRHASPVVFVLRLEVGLRLEMGTPLDLERVLVMRLSLHRELMALRVPRFPEYRQRPRIRALSCRGPRRRCLLTAAWSQLVGRQ